MITEFSRILYMIEETEWKLHKLEEEISAIQDEIIERSDVGSDRFMQLEYRRREIKSEIAEAEKELYYWNHLHTSTDTTNPFFPDFSDIPF